MDNPGGFYKNETITSARDFMVFLLLREFRNMFNIYRANIDYASFFL
jgi:hypothetical protein